MEIEMKVRSVSSSTSIKCKLNLHLKICMSVREALEKMIFVEIVLNSNCTGHK